MAVLRKKWKQNVDNDDNIDNDDDGVDDEYEVVVVLAMVMVTV